MISVHIPTARATYYRQDGSVSFTLRLHQYSPKDHTFINEDGHRVHMGTPVSFQGDTLTYRPLPSHQHTSPKRNY